MSKAVLCPTSIDRVRNRLSHAVKHGPTETLRELHSKALAKMDGLEKDLIELEEGIKELEEAYAKFDDVRLRARKQHVKMFGEASLHLIAMDANDAATAQRRLPARTTAVEMAKPMDVALNNFLDGGVPLAEFAAGAQLAIGSFPSPLTIAMEVWKAMDRSIDRLSQLIEAAEQYALRVEILMLVVAGFASLFRTLHEKIEQELDALS